MAANAKIDFELGEADQLLENLSAKLKNVLEKQQLWENTNFCDTTDDVYTQYLQGKISEIGRLRTEINAFRNPGRHFTKSYRILEQYCSQLYTDLDKIDTFARNELRENRKKAYQDVEYLLKDLAGKAHRSGAPCPKCEVQN